MYNKTSVWHIEVYELCSVIRAYFPAMEIEIYASSKQYLSFHFYFLRESELYKLLLNNTRSANSYTMNSEVYSCHLTCPHFCLFVLPPHPPTRYSKIYKVSKNPSLLIQGYIAVGNSINGIWTYLRGKHKGGRYEARNSFRNIEFIIITQETTCRDTHSWLCVPMTPFPWLLGSVILQVCFIGSFFLEIYLTLPLQIFLSSGYTSLLFHGPFFSTSMLFPEHSKWLLCTQLIKWMVHSLRPSLLLLSGTAT